MATTPGLAQVRADHKVRANPNGSLMQPLGTAPSTVRPSLYQLATGSTSAATPVTAFKPADSPLYTPPAVAAPRPEETPYVGNDIATVIAGLPAGDAHAARENYRQVTSGYQMAKDQVRTEFENAVRNRDLAFQDARLNQARRSRAGLAVAADSGLGASPGVGGAAVTAAVQQSLQDRADAQRELSTAQTGLQAAIDRATAEYNSAMTGVGADAALRRDYAAMIRKAG